MILGGIGLAVLTLYLHSTDQPRLAGIAAGVSLLFVLLIIIFVVPPLARNASREASQMNLPFEFTMGGAIMLGLIVIVGFSAWNTGNNLLFLVLSFLTAAMVAGFIAGGISVKKLDVKMRFPETIFAGEVTPILVSLHNRKRFFPSFSVIAEVRGNEMEESAAAPELRKLLPRAIAERLSRPPVIRRTLDYFVHIPRGETVERRTEHIFPERGRLIIKDFELSTRFPFAFFRHRRRLSARETELIVFPPIEPITNELDDQPLETGDLMSMKRGSGQDLLALRDYHPNDDMRRVDWKATARSRSLVVREFAAEDDKRVIIFFDTRLPADEKPKRSLRETIEAEQAGKAEKLERFERAVTLAASLVSHFTDEQAEVTLILDDTPAEGGIGPKHLYEDLRRLAVVEPSFEEAFDGEPFERLATAINESTGTHLFLLTAAPADTLPEELRSAAVVLPY